MGWVGVNGATHPPLLPTEYFGTAKDLDTVVADALDSERTDMATDERGERKAANTPAATAEPDISLNPWISDVVPSRG